MNTSTEDLRWKEDDHWIHESSNHHQSDIHDELGGTCDKCWYATNITYVVCWFCVNTSENLRWICWRSCEGWRTLLYDIIFCKNGTLIHHLGWHPTFMFRTNQDVGLEVNNLSFVPRNSAKRSLRRVMGAEQSCCVVEEDESPDVIPWTNPAWKWNDRSHEILSLQDSRTGSMK